MQSGNPMPSCESGKPHASYKTPWKNDGVEPQHPGKGRYPIQNKIYVFKRQNLPFPEN
jgi:hypothetical protein